MNGYKRVRRELGTVKYDIERKPNVYEQFYEKEAEAVREFVKHTKPSSQKPTEDEPKTVEIKEKKNKMEDIMALINDTGETTEDTGETKEINETKDAEVAKDEEVPKDAEVAKDAGETKDAKVTKDAGDAGDTPSGNQVGGRMKTIRVTNVKADPKKNALIL